MKKVILLFYIGLLSINANAQEGKWKVCVNKKTILETSKEDEQKNIKTISAKEWKKDGFLELVFTETGNDIWFYRHFAIVDKDETDYYRLDSTNTIKIRLKEFRNKVNGKKEIAIYTSLSPKDPTIAIRMRRIHLITLKLP